VKNAMGLGAVCEELVPPGAVSALHDGAGWSQLTVAGVAELIWHLLSPPGHRRASAATAPGAIFAVGDAQGNPHSTSLD
jgi:hypothetical protein